MIRHLLRLTSVALLAVSAQAGLIITEVAGPPSGSSVRIAYTLQDSGGTTSLRYLTPRTGQPDKDDPAEFIYDSPTSKPRVYYYIRDRDLGQTFTVGANPITLDALTLRLGASDEAVKPNAQGARVFIQLYKVTGTPVINNHGTTGPDGSGDGKYTRWKTYNPADAKTDDYIDGETLTPVRVVEGDLPSTLVKNDWLRFDFTGEDEITLEANSVYAWLIGFVEPAPDRAFSLANRFHPNDPAADYTGGHGLRRDGSTLDLDATFVRDLNDEADKEASRQAAAFPANLLARQAQVPGTFGFPDVEGHRDFRFYIEGAEHPLPPTAPPSITTADGTGADTFIDSSAPTTAQGADTRARIRNDGTTRKAYFRFDLSSYAPSGKAISGAELVFKIATADTGLPNPLVIHVHGLKGGDPLEGWSEGMTWNSGAPAHAGSAVVTDAAMSLGTFTITGGSVSAGQVLILSDTVLPGLLPLLQSDTDNRVTVILTYQTTTGKSLAFSTKENVLGGAGLTFAPVVKAGAAQTVILPEAASLTATLDDGSMLPGNTTLSWEKESGPGTVTFSAPNALTTGATFSAPGVYSLRLTATRGSFTGRGQVSITVKDSFAAWAGRVFPGGTPAEDQLPEADPDGDLLSNRLEYALLSDPLRHEREHVPVVVNETGFLTLTYRQNLAASNLSYHVLRSETLTGWAPASPEEEVLANSGDFRLVKARVPLDGERRLFLRLEVTQLNPGQ